MSSKFFFSRRVCLFFDRKSAKSVVESPFALAASLMSCSIGRDDRTRGPSSTSTFCTPLPPFCAHPFALSYPSSLVTRPPPSVPFRKRWPVVSRRSEPKTLPPSSSDPLHGYICQETRIRRPRRSRLRNSRSSTSRLYSPSTRYTVFFFQPRCVDRPPVLYFHCGVFSRNTAETLNFHGYAVAARLQCKKRDNCHMY